MLVATLWIALNLLILAYLWLSRRLRRGSARQELGHDATEALVRQLHRDLENHGPDWFEQNRKTRRGQSIISWRDERKG